MRIDNLDQVINKLKLRLPEYVESIISKPPGKSKFLCPSPDHNDNHPSACLNPHEDYTEGKCFSCGANFDIFTLANWNEGMPSSGAEFFNISVKELATRYNVPVSQTDLTEEEKELYATYRAMRCAADYVASASEGTWSDDIDQYITVREWNKIDLADMGVGVGSRDGLIAYMEKIGYSLSYLNEIGLISLGNDDGVPQVIDEGRLVFTIYDPHGRCIAFASRGFDQGPKFLNSPTSRIYTKGEVLYGIHIANRGKKKPLYLVEGYGDVITMSTQGYKHVACTCGTAVTSEQLLLVKKLGWQSVVLAFDFDIAGKAATDKAISVASKNNITELGIKIVNPANADPQECDPDSYIRKHELDSFLDLEQQTCFSWTMIRKTEEGVIGSELANLMVGVIATEPNAINREIQARELSKITEVSVHAIELEVEKQTNISLEERRQAQNAIIKRLSLDIDKDPSSALTASHQAVQELERVSKNHSKDSVTNSSFLTMIDVQEREEVRRSNEDLPVGFEIPLMPLLQEKWSGGDDYSAGTLFLLGGEENTGKSSFLSYLGMNVCAHDLNDSILIIFSIDDTGQQILPKLITSADCILQGGYQVKDPLTIGHVRNPRTIQDELLANRRDQAYDLIKELAQSENLVMKDAREGNTLSYLESVVRYYRQRHPNRRIIISVDNTHNLGDFGYMDDRSERYKRIANAQKAIVNRYQCMMFATVEYRKGNQHESKDIRKMMPDNNMIAETRALKYLASFIGHLYNDMHSRPNLYDTFHVTPGKSDHLPRILMNVGKTKFNGFKGVMSFDFYPASSAFVPVKNETVKLERTRYLNEAEEEEDVSDDQW